MLMLFTKTDALNACPQAPMRALQPLPPGRLSRLVTASLSSTGLGSLSTDLPAHSLGHRSQEGGLVTPASPSQSRSQRGMTHGYIPPGSPQQEGVVDREGEKGRGARLKEGMGMWRPRAGARGGLPPAMFDAYSCPSLSTQTPSRPGGVRCPRSLESRTSKSVPATCRVAKGLESTAARSIGGARAPPPCFVAGGGTAAGRAILSPVQPGLRAPLRPGTSQAEPRRLPSRSQPPAHRSSLGLQDLGPKGCPLPALQGPAIPWWGWDSSTSPELVLQRPYW